MNWQRASVSVCLLSVLIPLAAQAEQFDRPVLASYVQGHAKIVTLVAAGPSGAPAGFTMQWMKFSDFLANGGHFYDVANDLQSEARFTGTPTLNTWDGQLSSFTLGPSAIAAVEIGDLYDETGVTTTATAELELLTATPYIFRARAIGDGVVDTSEVERVHRGHGAESELHVHLGILEEPSRGLAGDVAHAGNRFLQPGGAAFDSESVRWRQRPRDPRAPTHHDVAQPGPGSRRLGRDATIAAAHAIIRSLVPPPVRSDSPSRASTSALTQTLDDYNNGVIGPGHCGEVSVDASSWSSIKSSYR
jgi:hypothetical protein